MKQTIRWAALFACALLLAGCAAKAERNAAQEEDTLLLAPEGAAGAVAGAATQEEDDAVLAFEAPTPSPTPAVTPAPTPTPLPTFTVETLEKQQGYVMANGVNLREGPHTAYEVKTVLDANTQLTIIGKAAEWYQVECEAQQGFLSAEFVGLGPVPTPKPTAVPYKVERMSSTTAYVNASTVNFRAGPHRSYDILAEAERYERVTITGTSGDWYRVKYNKKTGYMLKSYVRIGLSPANYKGAGSYSAADVLLMAQIAYRESARGDSDGYKAVASVILNRIHSSKYPSSVEKVVFQGNGAQFSPAENPNKLRLTKPSDACVQAVSEVMANGSILPSNVMYFRTASKGTSWSSARTYHATYGGNCYFS